MIDCERTNFPVCPHCGHKLTDDEVHASGVDVWALAPDEGEGELDCPACGKHYFIRGFYVPEYTTSRHNCDVCDGDTDCDCDRRRIEVRQGRPTRELELTRSPLAWRHLRRPSAPCGG